jgi:hypothetical protein
MAIASYDSLRVQQQWHIAHLLHYFYIFIGHLQRRERESESVNGPGEGKGREKKEI